MLPETGFDLLSLSYNTLLAQIAPPVSTPAPVFEVRKDLTPVNGETR